MTDFGTILLPKIQGNIQLPLFPVQSKCKTTYF